MEHTNGDHFPVIETGWERNILDSLQAILHHLQNQNPESEGASDFLSEWKGEREPLVFQKSEREGERERTFFSDLDLKVSDESLNKQPAGVAWHFTLRSTEKSTVQFFYKVSKNRKMSLSSKKVYL